MPLSTASFLKSFHPQILRAGLVALIGVGGFASADAAMANSGRSADYCLNVYDTRDGFEFVNNCRTEIFVMYCGDLKYSDKRCGDGDNGYYTHSTNIGRGQSDEIYVRNGGSASWASCEGSVSWNSSKSIIHDRYDYGRYTCLRK